MANRPRSTAACARKSAPIEAGSSSEDDDERDRNEEALPWPNTPSVEPQELRRLDSADPATNSVGATRSGSDTSSG